jgi:hypothetical protein
LKVEVQGVLDGAGNAATRSIVIFRGNSIFGSAPTMGVWSEEISIGRFDFFKIEPNKQGSDNDNEFIIGPCRLKVEVQGVLDGAGNATTGTVDIRY